MGLIKNLDRQAGIALRWLFNLVTGNYFIHLEKRQAATMRKLRNDVELSLAPVRRFHDDQQRAILDRYKADL